MSLTFVQGGVMAAETAFAADDAHHGPSGCDDCGGSDHEGMDAGTCLAVCGSATQGLMPGELLTPGVSFEQIEHPAAPSAASSTVPITVLPRSSSLADA